MQWSARDIDGGIFNERDIKPARVPELYRDIGKNISLILYVGYRGISDKNLPNFAAA